jgi:hypothetical protein
MIPAAAGSAALDPQRTFGFPQGARKHHGTTFRASD